MRGRYVMKKAKGISILLTFMLLVTVITGCTSGTAGTGTASPDSTTTADSTDASGSDTTAEDTKELDGQHLVIAINATFAPFESVKEVKNGEEVLEGLDIDLIEALSEKLGFTYEFDDMAFSGLIGALTSGRADVVISGISATEERKESVDFTRSYFTPLCAILCKEDAVYEHLSDLSGKTVAVSFGTTFQTLAEGIQGANVSAVDSTAVAFQEMQAGRADACLFDNNQAQTFAEENDGYVAVTLSADEAAQDPYAIACPKDSELTAVLDQALSELEEDGTINDLVVKWLGEEYLSGN